MQQSRLKTNDPGIGVLDDLAVESDRKAELNIKKQNFKTIQKQTNYFEPIEWIRFL